MTAASSTLLPIVLYLALSFVVALWAGKLSRKHENASGFLEEYFLGSRSMGGFVLAMTVVASYTSASSFIGGPGMAYTVGLSWVLLAMIQMPTVFLTIGVLGKRFAMEARAMNAVTITDYLRVRYGSDAVAILCSLALLVFFVAAVLACSRPSPATLMKSDWRSSASRSSPILRWAGSVPLSLPMPCRASS